MKAVDDDYCARNSTSGHWVVIAGVSVFRPLHNEDETKPKPSPRCVCDVIVIKRMEYSSRDS
jgi:hypothetical protein